MWRTGGVLTEILSNYHNTDFLSTKTWSPCRDISFLSGEKSTEQVHLEMSPWLYTVQGQSVVVITQLRVSVLVSLTEVLIDQISRHVGGESLIFMFKLVDIDVSVLV